MGDENIPSDQRSFEYPHVEPSMKVYQQGE